MRGAGTGATCPGPSLLPRAPPPLSCERVDATARRHTASQVRSPVIPEVTALARREASWRAGRGSTSRRVRDCAWSFATGRTARHTVLIQRSNSSTRHASCTRSEASTDDQPLARSPQRWKLLHGLWKPLQPLSRDMGSSCGRRMELRAGGQLISLCTHGSPPPVSTRRPGISPTPPRDQPDASTGSARLRRWPR